MIELNVNNLAEFLRERDTFSIAELQKHFGLSFAAAGKFADMLAINGFCSSHEQLREVLRLWEEK